MGIDMVTLVLGATIAPRLSQRELHVLALMARRTLDQTNAKDQQPGRYWAGWEHLAINLGLDPEAPRTYERVRRILKSLTEKGLIEPVHEHPRRGTRQEYLVLPGPRSPHRAVGANEDGYPQESPHDAVGANEDLRDGESPHVAVGRKPPRRGVVSPHGAVWLAPTARVVPRTERGLNGGLRREDPTQGPAHLTERAHEAAEDLSTGRVNEGDDAAPPHAATAKAHGFTDDGSGYCERCNLPRAHPVHVEEVSA